MTANETELHFTSDSLMLEGKIHLPDSSGIFPGVVICHPHPRFGGDMQNNVVLGLTDRLVASGIAAFRFNYRGVGNSEGQSEGGAVEVDDALAAISQIGIHENIDGSSLGIAGYSFGASIALQASVSNTAIQAVMSVACPMSPFRNIGVLEIVQPKLLISGEFDHDFPPQQFTFLSKRFADPKQVELIQDADHFFRGNESQLGDMAVAFFSHGIGSGPR